MTNYDANIEFLKESLLEKGYAQFGLDSIGNIKLCDEMGCSECKFKDPERSCREQRSEWLKQEFTMPIDVRLREVIYLEVVKCCSTPCDKCAFHNNGDRLCISTRIRDAIITNFNITNKED